MTHEKRADQRWRTMEHSDELFSGRQAEVELKVINDGGEASGRRRFGDATGGEETTGG